MPPNPQPCVCAYNYRRGLIYKIFERPNNSPYGRNFHNHIPRIAYQHTIEIGRGFETRNRIPTETISTSKKETLRITDILLKDTINKQTFSVYNPTTDTVVVDMNGRDAGRVIYHDGNIEKVVIDRWVEITKTSKSSFTVKGIGNNANYGYKMQVGVSRAKYTPSHILIQ